VLLLPPRTADVQNRSIFIEKEGGEFKFAIEMMDGDMAHVQDARQNAIVFAGFPVVEFSGNVLNRREIGGKTAVKILW
jgi:hypothetical protein